MKRKFLVSYWVAGKMQPNNREVTLDNNISNYKVPIELQKRLAEDIGACWPDAITILNFWEIK